MRLRESESLSYLITLRKEKARWVQDKYVDAGDRRVSGSTHATREIFGPTRLEPASAKNALISEIIHQSQGRAASSLRHSRHAGGSTLECGDLSPPSYFAACGG